MIDQFRGKYRYLSNFFYSEIELEGICFHSSEAAFQASKAPNLKLAKTFADLSPADAKKRGNKIHLRPGWEHLKEARMYYILKEKFQNPALAGQLVSTYPKTLIEGNTWGDKYWGVCDKVGQNRLGVILEVVRLELKKGVFKPDKQLWQSVEYYNEVIAENGGRYWT